MKKLITTISLVALCSLTSIAQKKFQEAVMVKGTPIMVPGFPSCTVAGLDKNPVSYQCITDLDEKEKVVHCTSVQAFEGDEADNKDIDVATLKFEDIDKETMPEMPFYDEGTFTKPVYRILINGKNDTSTELVKHQYYYRNGVKPVLTNGESTWSMTLYFNSQENAEKFLEILRKNLGL